MGDAVWWAHHWHDVLDVLSAIGTVAAAWLAWVAIRRGNEQANASADSLVRERRIDFELDQLDRIDDQLAKGMNSGFGPLTIQPAVGLLPADEFPHVRQSVGFNGTPDAEAVLREVNLKSQKEPYTSRSGTPLKRGGTYAELLGGEVHEAIDRRLRER